MVELPTEIWHHIASYLTDSELLGLLTVNRPFFYLSIAVRYRTLKLSVRDYSTSDKLEKLSHYGLFKFVKVVKLTVRSRGDWKSFGGEWRVSNFDAMLNAIQNVHSLEELHVIAEVQGDDYHAPDEYFCNFIRSLWSSIAVSSISSLHLICSTSSLERLIPLYHTFPSLSKIYLDIVTKANYLNDLNETLAATIVPFLNGHSLHLRTLSISSKNYKRLLDVKYLFRDLKLFPLLEEFRFDFMDPYCRTQEQHISSLQSFLSMHARKLTSLMLSLNLWNASLAASLVLTPCLSDSDIFRYLQKLDLRIETVGTTDCAIIKDFLSRCHRTLVDITLRDVNILPARVAMITDVLKCCPMLQILTIHLKDDSDIILFASIPTLNLQSLNVHLPISAWRGQNNGLFSFLREYMIEDNFRHNTWNLDDIGIYYDNKPATLKFLQMFASCIPSINSFWGQGYMC